VKKIVEGHNGKVWVESTGLEQGSTFHVELPLKQATEQYHAQPESIFKTDENEEK
jgi:signal transduction histidine kinase